MTHEWQIQLKAGMNFQYNSQHSSSRNIPSTLTPSASMYTSVCLVLSFCIAVSNAGKLAVSPAGFSPESASEDPFEGERIVPGEPMGARPFVGALVSYTNGRYTGLECTSSLIAPDRVLTAAHCFPDEVYDSSVELYFVYGLSDIREKSINRHRGNKTVDVIKFDPADDVVIHEGYVGPADGFLNDLAIIKLPRAVRAPKLKLMRLAKKEYRKDIYDIGWGFKNCTHSSTETLRWAKAVLLSNQECSKKLYEEKNGVPIPPSQMCSYFRTKDGRPAAVAKGDSGSPLFMKGSRPIQIGVASHAYFTWLNYKPPMNWRCMDPTRPQVFIRVSAYEKWIKKHAPKA